jgi:hypothetical protein
VKSQRVQRRVERLLDRPNQLQISAPRADDPETFASRRWKSQCGRLVHDKFACHTFIFVVFLSADESVDASLFRSDEPQHTVPAGIKRSTIRPRSRPDDRKGVVDSSLVDGDERDSGASRHAQPGRFETIFGHRHDKGADRNHNGRRRRRHSRRAQIDYGRFRSPVATSGAKAEKASRDYPTRA